jgi:hypothetical protein
MTAMRQPHEKSRLKKQAARWWLGCAARESGTAYLTSFGGLCKPRGSCGRGRRISAMARSAARFICSLVIG